MVVFEIFVTSDQKIDKQASSERLKEIAQNYVFPESTRKNIGAISCVIQKGNPKAAKLKISVRSKHSELKVDWDKLTAELGFQLSSADNLAEIEEKKQEAASDITRMIMNMKQEIADMPEPQEPLVDLPELSEDGDVDEPNEEPEPLLYEDIETGDSDHEQTPDEPDNTYHSDPDDIEEIKVSADDMIVASRGLPKYPDQSRRVEVPEEHPNDLLTDPKMPYYAGWAVVSLMGFIAINKYV